MDKIMLVGLGILIAVSFHNAWQLRRIARPVDEARQAELIARAVEAAWYRPFPETSPYRSSMAFDDLLNARGPAGG